MFKSAQRNKRVPQKGEKIKWGIALSSPLKRGNKKWGIIFSGNPNENPETMTIGPADLGGSEK